MDRLTGIFFMPPLAIARLGSSDTPLEAFDWVEDKSDAGGALTRINPALSFEVLEGGYLRAYIPDNICFKDQGSKIRPVAPFFELWATIQSGKTGDTYETPLTLQILKTIGVGPEHIHYRVTAANRKAESRTNAAETSFVARVEVGGDDNVPRQLLAVSPHSADQEPLVFADHPIPLGSFQVIRPGVAGIGGTSRKPKARAKSKQPPQPALTDADLNVIRVRYTPAKGQVYGPPGAIAGPASPLQPGEAEPSQSLLGRIHQIVPPANRFLNPNSVWSQFAMDTETFQPNSPIDSYDGANIGTNRSWGVVDDTCDVMIEARLVIASVLYQAQTRAFVGPPAYAPDRRPFYAVSDDLADRELPPVEVSEDTLEQTTDEILDLFNRVFETASTINLDAHRSWSLTVNASKVGVAQPNTPGWDAETEPRIGPASMTKDDKPYVDKVPPLTQGQPVSMFNSWNRIDRLPYKQVVDFVHAPLVERELLLSFLRRRADHVRRLIRKPLGTVKDLPARPGIGKPPKYRDPREIRERLYDMKMPPYMRHNMGYPLSLSIRQYRELMDFIDLLESTPASEKSK